MKIFQGFEALQYIMENKDKKLYTKNDQIMYYKDGIKIKGKYRDTTPIIDEHNMKIKWYTENKKQFNIRIYYHKNLIRVLNQYLMNTEENINATRIALLCKTSKELNISEDNINVAIELINDIQDIQINTNCKGDCIYLDRPTYDYPCNVCVTSDFKYYSNKE